jgi:hypothetical protein
MDKRRRDQIYRIAKARVFSPLWHEYCATHSDPAPSPFELLPIRPDQFIRRFLRLRLVEIEEILPDGPLASSTRSEIAGIIDRALEQITVATKFDLVVRRFTLAHELGHWFLHSGLVYHRDFPISGTEPSDGLSIEEREANLFAAEMLMPRRLVADLFFAKYGRSCMHPDEIDEELAFKLSLGTGVVLSPGDLKALGRRKRSRLLAKDTHLGVPMSDVFAVSTGAMAIRLEELDLSL